MKKSQSINKKLVPVLFLLGVLLLWHMISVFHLVPAFMLPGPGAVIKALFTDRHLLFFHMQTTLIEAFVGLFISIILSIVTAIAMDRYQVLYQGIYPILVITQTIPTVAIAPLLVLWLGYYMLPKIALVVIVCYFPITVSLLDGFKGVDPDMMKLMKSMKASYGQTLWHVKLPFAMPYFFSGLTIAVSYAIVGAVIAEWLGGMSGLGVYMMRVKKSYAFDKMFAVIFLISALSLLLMSIIKAIRSKVMAWDDK